MVNCALCWKNITGKPRNVITNKINGYRICNECLNTKVIQEMLEKDWKVILETPDLKEMMTKRSEAT